MLRAYARGRPVPSGLADRVFEASAALLPRQAAAPRGRTWTWSSQPFTVGSLWGRLAMAASIALAFFVAARMAPHAAVAPPLSPDVELVLLELAGDSDGLLADFDDPVVGRVEHLLVTRDMTFQDLTSDLAALAADLEM